MAQLMIDIAGTELTAEDKKLLASPAVNGLILFTRNFASLEQLQELIREARAAAAKPLLIAVDHEGGRVQRFREGFSAIPSMGSLQKIENEDERQRAARDLGWLMAAEVQAVGIDISFAPVLDVDDCSDVIGDRAFSAVPSEISKLASSFIEGMHEAGMACTGKHFPGHGSVQADSHIAIPEDDRTLEQIRAHDLKPFLSLSQKLDGIMPAHVIYPQIDPQPAGFSEFWLQQILRSELQFNGTIFSDDLSMQGATVAGDMQQRAVAALNAGCDMILVCNDRAGAVQVLDADLPATEPESAQRVNRMLMSSNAVSLEELKRTQRWEQAQRWL
ncbi:UNVERIFIED_ORG: beta-N-acetylhexosaminidase [Idiomarina abyssalis]|uniref:beta-N-acetylhexosaminidase n=1 Tax=unclassified Idiomarina TaxID=2614829 RepID=UPI000E0FCA78|nr:beta-N-acetylhexosaminidase [Idiomarina sp. 017G]TDO53249.1 beta-N-acetylhexosaminidase [Idiomarina sp. 017G]